MELKSVISILGYQEDEKEGNRDRREQEAPGVRHGGLSSWLHHLPELRHTTSLNILGAGFSPRDASLQDHLKGVWGSQESDQ